MSTPKPSSANEPLEQSERLGVDYFLLKLSCIPEDEWGCRDTDRQAKKKTAFGHCGCNMLHFPEMNAEALELSTILYQRVVEINEGFHPRYKQPTPKQRILAALRDAKKDME